MSRKEASASPREQLAELIAAPFQSQLQEERESMMQRLQRMQAKKPLIASRRVKHQCFFKMCVNSENKLTSKRKAIETRGQTDERSLSGPNKRH